MLTEEDKARIKAEEIYRHEINNELSRGKDKKRRLWLFLNSAIFLWLLSTVAVGGITWTWTYFHNRWVENRAKEEKLNDEARQRQQRIDMLNFEIEGRLSQFIVDVESMVEKHCDDPIYRTPYRLKAPYTDADIQAKWMSMKSPPRNQTTASSIYPEFADRGIVSLIVELDKLQPETEANPNGPSLGMAAVAIQANAIFPYPNCGQTEGVLPIWMELRNRVIRPEWSTFFPYTDCTGSFPFC